MITKEIKISKMLDEYPETLETLLQASPHFSKLKNKFLRKALAGRVTVAQAAGIAGLSLDVLLFKLNDSIGKREEYLKSMTSTEKLSNKTEADLEKPVFLNNLSEEKTKTIDVRQDIASGQDPFKRIMSFVKELKDDEVMHLINSFEPIPLYSVLKKKGLDHWTEVNDDVVNVFLFRNRKEKNTIEPESSSNELVEPTEAANIDEKIIQLDVSTLEPPEPMLRILETLPSMDDNTMLLVHHHRDPLMLYEKLEERGFQAVTNKIEENYFKIVITKKKNNGR